MKVHYNYQTIFEQNLRIFIKIIITPIIIHGLFILATVFCLFKYKSFISTAPVKYKNALNLKNKRFKALKLFNIYDFITTNRI